MAEINPLNAETKRKVDKLLAACKDTSEYLAKCKRCELDVDEQIQDNGNQQRVLTKIKREFFPKEA